MARLIDFDKLKDIVENGSPNRTEEERRGAEFILDVAEYLVEEQETVDAVEVVRCRDCADYGTTTKLGAICNLTSALVKPDDYCSYGERRDSGNV